MKKPSSHLSIGTPQNPKAPPHTKHAHRAMEIVSIPKNALNITHDSDSLAGKILSNLAPSPFILDGKKYESVEAFWQWLKFEDDAQRAIIARLSGLGAKKAGEIPKPIFRFIYNWEVYVVGSGEHHNLMRRAIRAKLEQNSYIKNLLLSTKNIPLVHMPKRKDDSPYPDNVNIPGVIFAQILMDLREEFLALKK